ncbi:MAG: tetratricopeptide repeat protein [Candidatus Limimorpha sp.]
MLSLKKSIAAVLLLFVVTNSLSAQKRISDYEPESVFLEAKTLYDNKNFSSAAELFGRYLQLSDDMNSQKSVEAAFYEAVCSSYIGAGEQKLMRFSKENPTSTFAAKADFIYANVLFNNKKTRDALRVFESLDEESLSYSEKAELYFKKGIAYYRTNNLDNAKRMFSKSAVMESEFQNDARYYYAHILYLDKEYNDAKYYFKKIENDPKYKDIVPVYLMQIDFADDKYSSVTENADVILSKTDGNHKVDAALVIAESWYQQNNYEKALNYYDIAIQNTKRALSPEVEYRIGFCKFKTADYQGAIANFQNASKKNNDELAQYATYYLAKCYLNTEQDKFARNAYLSAYKNDFDHEMSIESLFDYAKLSFIPGVDPFNEAVGYLNDFLAKYPDSQRADEARTMIVHLYLNHNEYNNALRAIEDSPNLNNEMERIYAQLTYNIGIQYYSAEEYDLAISYLSKTKDNANADSRLKVDAAYWIADSYFQKKDFPAAEKQLLQFLKMPGSEQSEMFPYSYYNFGYLFYQKGKFANAVKEFNYFININKGGKDYESDAWMRIGDCFFMERNYSKAVNAYENAEKLDSRDKDYALFQKGMANGAMGNTNAKILSLNELVKSYANSSFYDRALFEIGMAHLNGKDERSAIASFNKLVKERPRSPYARQALLKIGMLYYNNDQYDNALANLEKVVSDYKNTEESREALAIIKNIYMETNRTSDYFKYMENNGVTTTVSEQDSLSFKTAENFFKENKYEQAFTAANNYIEKFPDGAFLLKINYYALTSLERLNRTDEILPYLEFIVAQPDNDYTDNALLKIARVYYDAADYEKSGEYYNRLAEITENQKVKAEALEGVMKISYFTGDLDKAISCGEQLFALTGISQTQKNQVNYIVGKCMFDRGDYMGALTKLEACVSSDKTALGAEAAYYAACCSFKLGSNDEAENKVFDMSDNYSSHTFWVAKAFILLSDVYVAKDNVYQAKETLKSVIENYPGNDLKNEATQKLNSLEENENNNVED